MEGAVEGSTSPVLEMKGTSAMTQENRSSYHPKSFAIDHWPFQVPKLKVPTIYKAYVRPM